MGPTFLILEMEARKDQAWFPLLQNFIFESSGSNLIKVIEKTKLSNVTELENNWKKNTKKKDHSQIHSHPWIGREKSCAHSILLFLWLETFQLFTPRGQRIVRNKIPEQLLNPWRKYGSLFYLVNYRYDDQRLRKNILSSLVSWSSTICNKMCIFPKKKGYLLSECKFFSQLLFFKDEDC